MLGGAYAASDSGSGGKATASAKAKKGPRGPKGATGPAGPAGPQGPAGPAGAKGDAGANGANGSNGATGPTGLQGNKGATGLQGTPGATGFSGFTETLPSGKTEKGAWGAFTTSTVETFPGAIASISFPIPLAAAGQKSFYFTPEETELEKFGKKGSERCVVEVGEPLCIPTGCEGTLEEPTAPAGVLCVYTAPASTGVSEHVSGRLAIRQVGGEANGYSESGAFVIGPFYQGTAAEPAVFSSEGSWAVTAP
jgi:hypothetical protein